MVLGMKLMIRKGKCMLKNKPVYNYDIEQCNQLFKRGINPIGCGTNDKTGNVFHVFVASKKYFDMVKLINYELNNEEVK